MRKRKLRVGLGWAVSKRGHGSLNAIFLVYPNFCVTTSTSKGRGFCCSHKIRHTDARVNARMHMFSGFVVFCVIFCCFFLQGPTCVNVCVAFLAVVEPTYPHARLCCYVPSRDSSLCARWPFQDFSWCLLIKGLVRHRPAGPPVWL